MPVVRLAEWSRLRLVVPVPESAVPELHLGQAINVVVPALGRTFNGKVARFADSLNEETRTMHTEIDVENPDDTLVDGMYAETRSCSSKRTMRSPCPFRQSSATAPTRRCLSLIRRASFEQRPVDIGRR